MHIKKKKPTNPHSGFREILISSVPLSIKLRISYCDDTMHSVVNTSAFTVPALIMRISLFGESSLLHSRQKCNYF